MIKNAYSVGSYFIIRLRDALGDHINVGDICGEGLLAAVELVADRDGRVFLSLARKSG